MRSWEARYGRLPTSYDWSRTHARRRGGDALARLEEGEWPAASVVTRLFGSWVAAREAALCDGVRRPASGSPARSSRLGSDSVSLPNPRESTAISEDLRGGGKELQHVGLQGFCICGMGFAHNSGR